MYLAPAIIVHDAIIAYSKAKDIEALYDHYQESFYEFLDKRYGFRLPFDLEVACSYFEKTIMEKGSEPRHFSISGTNRAVYDVLTKAIKYGKKVEFLDEGVDLNTIKSKIDDGHDIISQYVKSGGNASFNRDFSYGSYNFKFVD